MSRVYCVVLDAWDTAGQQIEELIESHYKGRYYSLPDRGVFLLDTVDTAKEVATALGLRGESDDDPPPAAGIVLSVNGQFSGYTYATLGRWLREHRETSVS